jgi:hypothetical protein
VWQLPHAQIVDDQERNPRQIGKIVFTRAIKRRVGKFFEERMRFTIEHAIALLNHGAADGLGQMTFPRPWRP